MQADVLTWNIAFVLGAALFAGGILYACLRKEAKKEDKYLTAAIFEFAAMCVLMFPSELFGETPELFAALPFGRRILQIVKGFLAALSDSFSVGYTKAVWDGHPLFSDWYAVLMLLVNTVRFVFAAGYVIQFLDGPAQQIRLFLHGGRTAYIFSACNEKTLALAKSIPDKKKNLVFAGSGKDLETEEKDKIDELKGVRFGSSAAKLLNKVIGRSQNISLFLFGSREEDNLKDLDEIGKLIRKQGSSAEIRIYAELAKTPWAVYDNYYERFIKAETGENASLPRKEKAENVVINFIRTEENFAYNNFLENSIFETAVSSKDGQVREINFLLAGMNERNLEVMKALLHLSQMPGYRLSLLVLDGGAHRAQLRQKMPEVCDGDYNRDGDAFYTLTYLENVDFASPGMENAVESCLPGLSFAFINAGDDLLNAELAMRLNAFCLRKGRREDEYRIQVNFAAEGIYEKWNPDLTKNISAVGMVKNVYDHTFITMSDMEKIARKIHEIRHPEGPSWADYCNDEYRRHSVYARALSQFYRIPMLEGRFEETASEESKEYEHMRWNMYTRTLGYEGPDAAKSREITEGNGKGGKNFRKVIRIHPDLVRYEALTEEEKDKDEVKITEKIAEAIREVKAQRQKKQQKS